jgi:tRNA pseudouridine38-40 synthase
MRIRILVSYDGTDFCGWQRQDRQVTVQGTIEKALSRLYGQAITIQGASRTDSGVHAIGQVAHFTPPKAMPGLDLPYALRGLLPPSISIREAWEAPGDFHAIASSIGKTYRYVVLNRRTPSALRFRYTHWVRFPLDLDYLNEASQFLVGKQDFKSFQTSGTEVKSTIREIRSVSWERQTPDTLVFTITGDGFLKQMVRNIVGTLIEFNQDGEEPAQLQKVIAALDRRRAGVTAPPQGLYLLRVYYPEALDNKCRKL